MLNKINAIVVFVQDLEKSVAFYRDTLGVPETFHDDVSYGFQFSGQDFLLLTLPAAAEMVGQAALEPTTGGRRVLLCVGVENVDQTCDALKAKGVPLLKAPEDKAWGRRTAYFTDPEGNLWELYHELP